MPERPLGPADWIQKMVNDKPAEALKVEPKVEPVVEAPKTELVVEKLDPAAPPVEAPKAPEATPVSPAVEVVETSTAPVVTNNAPVTPTPAPTTPPVAANPVK